MGYHYEGEDNRMDNNNMNNNSQQQDFQQNMYQQVQNPYQEPVGNLEEPVSFGEWMITLLVMLIPCVNIVMMFVWAFGSGAKKSKSNYFKAQLIYFAIVIVLYIIIFAIFGATIASQLYY